MSERKIRVSKKAGLSGLFHARMVAAALLIASTTIAVAEPLAIEVTEATALLDVQSTQPVIAVKMSRSSAKQFAQFTLRNVGHKIDIKLDGKTVASPVIREPILQGNLQISGGLTMPQARDLADSIATGKSKIGGDLANE